MPSHHRLVYRQSLAALEPLRLVVTLSHATANDSGTCINTIEDLYIILRKNGMDNLNYNYQASLVFPNALSSCKRSVVPSGEPRNDMYLSQQYCQNVYSPDSTAPVYTTYQIHIQHVNGHLSFRKKNQLLTSLRLAGITCPLLRKLCNSCLA